MLLFLLLLLYASTLCNAQFDRRPAPADRRPVDLWNPFGTTTTRRPGANANEDEVVVRLSVGVLIGRKHSIENVPWLVDHDPLEQIRETDTHFRAEPRAAFQQPHRLLLSGRALCRAAGHHKEVQSEHTASINPSNPSCSLPQLMNQLPGDGPYLALEYGASCAQEVEARPSLFVNDPYPFRVSEDCLYLNIFTPDASKTSSRNYPVIAFFHGGNFQTGSGNEWPGHVLASRGIVVVAINYRLGAFGFMSLGDTDTGNYGIQDQRCALTWIQQHIAAFGGDPQQVTIVGHDAGAVSAGIHMLSPYSKHLFRSVAAMSGAEVSYHSTIGKPALAFNNTLKLGRYLGCTQPVARHIEYNRYLFLPTVNSYDLAYHPLWTLNNVPVGGANLPSPVPYLTGLNVHDGSEVILEDRTLGEFTNFLEVDRLYLHSWVIEYAYRHNYTMNREAIIEAIEAYYTYWPDPADVWRIREKFIQSAYLHSLTGSRTFFYVNSYNFSASRQNTFDPAERVFPTWMGSCHECDLYLLFGFPFMPRHLLPKHFQNVTWYMVDRNASQLFSTMFRQFVKYSDPNLPREGRWPAYEPRAHWYLDFNYTQFSSLHSLGTVSRDYRYEEVAFWNHYIPSLVNYMTTTFPPSEVTVRRALVTFKVITACLVIFAILLLVLCLSFGYRVWDRKRYDEVVDRRTLQKKPPTDWRPGPERNAGGTPTAARA
ncbi:COesterase domain-containing protein [Aphelenchoides fujianensis]|nr:COesterase domain-containing protein [Aphelenchoides fujianensis]